MATDNLLNLPVIDLGLYLQDPTSDAAQAEARKCAQSLIDYGALVVRDPRVTEEDNNKFIDMVEDYFDQPTEVKMNDVRADLGFQIGATPELTEEPRCKRDPVCQDVVHNIPEQNQPLPFEGKDPKWRFFWRIGEQPKETKFPRLNAPQVVPKGFPQWPTVMDSWGNLMHDAVNGVAEMTSVGLGLGRSTLPDMTKYGPHLLAPTASDLGKYGEVNTVLAGFHYDLNLLTIHGKSRYPGLHIWPRNGKEKMMVRVPDGCLLVQAGKMMEILTGGVIVAGYHEVVVNEATVKAIERVKAAEVKRPLWRISSTFFLHIASDQYLRPLSPLDQNLTEEQQKKYLPPIMAGDHVQRELSGINLMSD
ncbi:Clavaminate synthase-like protein [Ramicandelaber brevisporus]|nr:Clavaminate synthase-like protein [Ramicandelaber brevisporus]